MSETEISVYSGFHRSLLQILISQHVLSKQQLQEEIIPALNKQFNVVYDLQVAVEAINKKLRDFSFSISEVSCDDGVTYYCFNNKVVDLASSQCALSKDHLQVLTLAIQEIQSQENISYDMVVSSVKSSMCNDALTDSIFQDLLEEKWLLKYSNLKAIPSVVTVVAGPRLLVELGSWLVDTLNVPECSVCMDPVVGGINCPHSCGAVLHRSCAYKLLLSSHVSDDYVKGKCPGCKEAWFADISQFSDSGRIYYDKIL